MVKKNKIAIIGVKGLPAFGGSARAGENMLKILHDDYDFTVYTVSSHTSRKSGNYDGYRQLVFKSFPVRSLNTFIYYFKSLIHCMLRGEYDIVHVFHIDAAYIIPILKLKYKVIAGHRARPQESSKWNCIARIYFHLMEFMFYKMPAHIITSVSKPIIVKYQPYTRREMKYIPNGILFEDITPKFENLEFSDYIIFTAGRIMETKGCHILLEALNNINYTGLIVIIGNLKHEPEYAQRLYKLSENLNVQYINLIKDKNLLMTYIQKAKLAVFPTFLEAMSNMLLEIASLKTPLICSDIPENTIVLGSNEALHFKSEDSDDLSEKISWALGNPDKMKELANNAYKKLLKYYNWRKLAREYDKLYQLLLNK